MLSAQDGAMTNLSLYLTESADMYPREAASSETRQRDSYADDASIAVALESCSCADAPVFRGAVPQSGYSSGRLITIASWVLRAITTSAGVVGSGFSSRCGRYGGTKT
jgi:hypothetical protein